MKKIIAVLALMVVGFALVWGYVNSDESGMESSGEAGKPGLTEMKPAEPVNYQYGLPVDSFLIEESEVQKGESFGNILLEAGVDYSVIHTIAEGYRDIFDVRHIRSGKPYKIFKQKKDSNTIAKYLVYQPSLTEYYVFELGDSVNVRSGRKEVSTRTREVSGVITSSLYESLQEKGASPALTMELSTIYAWTIDFFRIKKGDHFKVVYEERFIDDTTFVGIGRILAADFNHGGVSFYSFLYNNDDSYSDYFDEKGKTLRKAFLKAPLEFSRISSRYNPNRYHPVLKRVKPHLGTDYAAPHGTPIMATADGTVIAAAYTRGNGNYVKIRHNSTYTTQYLHMSKFASGMKTGKVVRQGDVIGYVGSTGLATGPHVCYRFWVNGRQKDPYKEKLPEADPIKEEYREDYMAEMREMKKRLDAIRIDGVKVEKPKDAVASSRDSSDNADA